MDDTLLKKDDDASTVAVDDDTDERNKPKGQEERYCKDDDDDYNEEEESVTESSEITLASPQDEVNTSRLCVFEFDSNNPIALFLQDEDNVDPDMQHHEGCIMQRYLDPPTLKTKPLKPVTTTISLRNKFLHALRFRSFSDVNEAPSTPIPRRPFSEGSLSTLSYNAYRLGQKPIIPQKQRVEENDNSEYDQDLANSSLKDETSTVCEPPPAATGISSKKMPKSILKRQCSNPANIMTIPKTFYYHTSSNCSGHISLLDPREQKLRQRQQQQQQQREETQRIEASGKRYSGFIDGSKRRKWLGRIRHSVIHHHHNHHGAPTTPSSCSPCSSEKQRPWPSNYEFEGSVRRVRFSKAVHVRETYSRAEYNREPDPFAVCAHLTPEGAMQIKAELNTFKWHEMQVHPCSRINTHFFPNCN